MSGSLFSSRSPAFTRRSFLASAGAGAAFASGAFPFAFSSPAGAAPVREFGLHAAPGRVRLVPDAGSGGAGETAVWCYNGRVPGPEIRVRQGERLRLTVGNGLGGETSLHCHGVRLPHAMDGVPHLTQPPIGAGKEFVYEFDAVDAGTFWYHPHMNSAEQVGRGLYGPLVIEEPEPPRVDRDLVWMLDDWRLDGSAAIRGGFGSLHDSSHGGRLGNVVTINGRVPESFAVRRGERVRLRLVNAANARIFALDFGGHRPVVIALDGQPVAPHEPEGGLVVLGPAMRVDIMLDMTGQAGSRASVIDRFHGGQSYRLVDLAYGTEALRDHMPDWPLALPANPLPEPDIASALRHDVVFNGGMGGAGMMGGGRAGGGMMERMGSMMRLLGSGNAWLINGAAAGEGHVPAPFLTLERDRSHVISMVNETAWHHPMHLHGHSFRVITRNGRPTRHREWQDTVLMAPRETVGIALVADNPGDWMFHCHILEHQMAGMMGVVRVA